jgi:hypothetical protein
MKRTRVRDVPSRIPRPVDRSARTEVLYSDHDHRLILLTSDQAVAATATKAWDP